MNRLQKLTDSSGDVEGELKRWNGIQQEVEVMISIVSQEEWEGKEEESDVNFVEVLSIFLRKRPARRKDEWLLSTNSSDWKSWMTSQSLFIVCWEEIKEMFVRRRLWETAGKVIIDIFYRQKFKNTSNIV